MKNLTLKALIILKFGNQTDFCRAVGLREDKISKLIHGRLIPTIDEKALICEKLGMPENEVFPQD